jgi:hypothetical protein
MVNKQSTHINLKNHSIQVVIVAFQRGRIIGAIEKPDKRSTRYRLFHPRCQAFDFADRKN